MARMNQELTIKVDVDAPAIIEMVKTAVLAERKRCADWCEKTAFIGYAKDRILSGEQP